MRLSGNVLNIHAHYAYSSHFLSYRFRFEKLDMQFGDSISNLSPDARKNNFNMHLTSVHLTVTFSIEKMPYNTHTCITYSAIRFTDRRLAFERIGISFAQIFSFICLKKKLSFAQRIYLSFAKNLPFICANYFYDCVPLLLTLLPLAHHEQVEVGF